MALLKLRLSVLKLVGRFPNTETLEAQDKALREEFEEFNHFSQSNELNHFLSLQEFVKSGEPDKVKNELNALKYAGSQEHQKEQEFTKLSKDKTLINYFKVKNSSKLELFRNVELSGKPTRFIELQQVVESSEYKNNRRQHKKENSDEYQHEIEFKKLKADSELKQYFKLKKWKPLNDYFSIESSEILPKYEELKSYIESAEFKARKEYLLSKSKFEKSDAYQKLQEFKNLEKSEKIVWFFHCQKSNKFDDIKRWKLTFEENFDTKKLDSSKWITRYFWGEALLNKSYSLAADHHWYTDESNFEITNSTLKIITKQEATEGIAWDFKYGFVPKSFNYTSGLISTGQSFRQKEGRFEAKIKLTSTKGIYHAFWLVGDKTIPEIDILRQKGDNSSSFQGAYFWMNGEGKTKKSITSVGGLNLKNNFFILSIDWDANSIVWKINGIPYKEEKNNLPDSPLYVVISSGVNSQPNDANLPVTLEVDWVRCWKNEEAS
ncbi:MAG TPA: glycoside hydrolase family 16 protein [Tenuifilaceae bacterium]|nr:glycoside hydrolase family 16 protein [Tenuifilaceae bacterium]HPE17773.1 glycoside hydrolase family 16 protein [Tenuifilaceae bacterium]HPJ45024.1 glycoside hydrolase family 16 protein [Tenuifilaceae bacterium]HPQ34152.1 glycoside hydrolase family 16 protein [Tenuifilaceae bacterium]HRX67148.1 glycoside hydrolase family 16 protein [Tenuifilaceae bacterium]